MELLTHSKTTTKALLIMQGLKVTAMSRRPALKSKEHQIKDFTKSILYYKYAYGSTQMVEWSANWKLSYSLSFQSLITCIYLFTELLCRDFSHSSEKIITFQILLYAFRQYGCLRTSFHQHPTSL